jgi:hypothetical protein
LYLNPRIPEIEMGVAAAWVDLLTGGASVRGFLRVKQGDVFAAAPSKIHLAQ